jgi:hypothetical protein
MVEEPRQTLDQLAIKHNTDKATVYSSDCVHGYAPIYESYLKKWRDSPINLLEIGVWMEISDGGESIRMWNEYFSQASINTFDIRDMHHHPAVVENDRVKFYQGDQGNRESLQSMYKEYGNKNFDFILEDGSHEYHHQMISLGQLFQYVKPGGYYILEDMSIPGNWVCCIRNDETYRILREFQETGKITSDHLLPEEITYLQENVKNIEIYPDIQNAYAVAIITKK